MPAILYSTAGSPPAGAVILLIRQLNLDIEIKPLDFEAGEHRTDEYARMNPQKLIPTLNDDGFYLWESRAISIYLVESRAPGNSLYPDDVKQKAVINRLLNFDMGTLYNNVMKILNIVFDAGMEGTVSIPEDFIKSLHTAFELADVFLEDKKYFAGDNVTLADLAILASISAAVHIGADISKYSRLSAWFESCKTLPGYEENDKNSKMLGDYFKIKAGDIKF